MSEREQLEAELAAVKRSIEAFESTDLAFNPVDVLGFSSLPALEQAGEMAELYSRKAEIEKQLVAIRE